MSNALKHVAISAWSQTVDRRTVAHRSPANQVRHDDQPWSARVADQVTALFGSWGFIVGQSVLIVIWLGYNGYVAVHAWHTNNFDPYPFILLNLLFSTQAAYAAPLILLSQNRTAERDRVKAEHDFDVNVLALRALAELLGNHPDNRRDLLVKINDLLGSYPTAEAGATGHPSTAPRRGAPAEPPARSADPRGRR